MPVRAVAVVATAIAIASAWHSGPGVWRRLDTEHRVYAGYSDFQRRLAPVADVPLPTGIFEFWAGSVLPRDRIFFQVRPAPFSAFFDLPEIVSAAVLIAFLIPLWRAPRGNEETPPDPEAPFREERGASRSVDFIVTQ